MCFSCLGESRREIPRRDSALQVHYVLFLITCLFFIKISCNRSANSLLVNPGICKHIRFHILEDLINYSRKRKKKGICTYSRPCPPMNKYVDNTSSMFYLLVEVVECPFWNSKERPQKIYNIIY